MAGEFIIYYVACRFFTRTVSTLMQLWPDLRSDAIGVAVGSGSRHLPILKVFLNERRDVIVLRPKPRDIAAYTFFEV